MDWCGPAASALLGYWLPILRGWEVIRFLHRRQNKAPPRYSQASPRYSQGGSREKYGKEKKRTGPVGRGKDNLALASHWFDTQCWLPPPPPK